MSDNKLNQLAQTLADTVPASIKEVGKTGSEKLKPIFDEILKTAIKKMDLVTREEFDVQAKILARCQEKLDALEAERNKE